MNNYILKACRNCGGDLAMDNDDWICLQCGRYSYVGLYDQPDLPVDSLLPVSGNPRPARAHLRRAGLGADGHRGKSVGSKTSVPFTAGLPALAGAHT